MIIDNNMMKIDELALPAESGRQEILYFEKIRQTPSGELRVAKLKIFCPKYAKIRGGYVNLKASVSYGRKVRIYYRYSSFRLAIAPFSHRESIVIAMREH